MAVPVLVMAGRSLVYSQNQNLKTVTIPTPSGIQVGDLLIAFVSQQGRVNSASAMVQPPGWTRIDTYRSDQRGVCIAVKALKTAGDVSAQPSEQTWENIDATTGGRFNGAIYRITGANLDSPLDGEAASWTAVSPASAGDYVSLLASPPAADSLGLGMFYAHTLTTDTAVIMAGSEIIEQQTATDQVSNSTSSLVIYRTDDASRSTTLSVASGTYSSGSGVQLSIASANPSVPDLGLYRIGYTKHSETALISNLDLVADDSLQVGDWMLATVALSAPAADDSVVAPAGWTQVYYEGTSSGTYKTYFFTKQVTDTTKTYTFTIDGSPRGMMGSMMWFRGCAPATSWAFGTFWNRNNIAGNESIVRAPGITTTKPNTLVMSFGIERTLANETGISSVTGGATEWFFVEQKVNSNANTTLWWGAQEVLTPATTSDTLITYPNPQTINGWGIQIAIPGAPVPGYGVKYWDGSAVQDASLYIQGASKLETPIDVQVVPNPRYTVAKMLAEPTFYWSHRGGGNNWPEMTMHAYTQSILWGANCIEISVQRTSDGVWIGSHDASTLRVTGVDKQIKNTTWAELQPLMTSASATNNPSQPARPLVKLTDVLDLYSQSHVIVLDNKSGANTTEFLDLMEQYDPTHERLIWKGYRTGTSAPYAAQARGFTTWGFMYDADATNAALDLGCWDLLGLNYDATEAEWSAIKAHGKPVVAHIINSAAAATMALSKGADGLQCSNVKQVIPHR